MIVVFLCQKEIMLFFFLFQEWMWEKPRFLASLAVFWWCYTLFLNCCWMLLVVLLVVLVVAEIDAWTTRTTTKFHFKIYSFLTWRVWCYCYVLVHIYTYNLCIYVDDHIMFLCSSFHVTQHKYIGLDLSFCSAFVVAKTIFLFLTRTKRNKKKNIKKQEENENSQQEAKDFSSYFSVLDF